MHYLLFYEKAPDYEQTQIPLQADHSEHVYAAINSGDIVLAGNLGNPDGAALILFQSDTAAVAEKFARSDPYVVHGVVSNWYVRGWDTISIELPK